MKKKVIFFFTFFLLSGYYHAKAQDPLLINAYTRPSTNLNGKR
jgi:hypothetical protein